MSFDFATLPSITLTPTTEISDRAVATMAYATSDTASFQDELKDVIGVATAIVNSNHKSGIVRYRLSVRVGSVSFSFEPINGVSDRNKGLPKNPQSTYKSARPVDAVALLFILRALAGLNPVFSDFANLAFVSDEDFATRVGAVCAWLTGKSKGITFDFGLQSITLRCRTMEYKVGYYPNKAEMAKRTAEALAAVEANRAAAAAKRAAAKATAKPDAKPADQAAA